METTTLIKIGVFGGTFDPFTLAHLNIIEKTIENKFVDAVSVVPTIVDYHRAGKESWLTRDKRLDVINKILHMSKFYHNISIDTQEYEFADKHSKYVCSERRYIHTLMDIKDKFYDTSTTKFEFYTIIGTDSAWNFKTWHNYKDILDNSKLIGVAGRDGVDLPHDVPFAHLMTIDKKYSEFSASSIRQQYKDKSVDKYLEDATDILMDF